MKKVNWVSVFVYVSIGFLLYYLKRNDFLVLPKIQNIPVLLLSFLILFIGYLSNGLTWHMSLKKAGIPKTNYWDAVTSIGLSIFGKYIPGKVWMIVGRAAYLSNISGVGIKKLSVLSLNVQFAMLWCGLIVGTAGIVMVGGWEKYGLISLAGIAAIGLLVFSDYMHRIIIYAAKKILKRDIDLPQISFKDTIILLPFYFVHWLIWALSFYLLACALSTSDILPEVGLAFPLAGTIGIIAVFAPGGLGVREGVIVAFLTLSGLDLKEATSISVAARLWFLVGEFFIFAVAVVNKQIKKTRHVAGS